MCSARFLSALLIVIAISVRSSQAQETRPTPSTESDRPIQALLVTGGCCHDYDRQKLILTRGISARANVRWTVVHQGGTSTDTKIPLYDDPNWVDGFDIVVHNECFAHVTLRVATGVSRELLQDNIEDRVKQEISMMPLGIVGNLGPEQLADLIAYLESLH